MSGGEEAGGEILMNGDASNRSELNILLFWLNKMANERDALCG